MKSVIKWFQSISQTTQPIEDPETPHTSLYVCGECNSVYISAEMEACSTCEVHVEQVSATFDGT